MNMAKPGRNGSATALLLPRTRRMEDCSLWDKAANVYAELAGTSVEEITRDRIAKTPLGRAAQPLDVARVIAFLVSEDADYMTGQALNVTGGLVAF